jgi:hypothetical protein
MKWPKINLALPIFANILNSRCYILFSKKNCPFSLTNSIAMLRLVVVVIVVIFDDIVVVVVVVIIIAKIYPDWKGKWESVFQPFLELWSVVNS